MAAPGGGISFNIQARNAAQASFQQLLSQLQAAQAAGNLTAQQMATLTRQVASAGASAASLDALVRRLQAAGSASTQATGTPGGSTGFLGMAGAMAAGQVAATVLMGAVQGVTGAIVEQVQAAFQYNSTIAAQTTAYESMTGSAEKAEETVSSLVNFANRTPFDSKTVLDFGQKLLFAGQSAESLIPTMEAVGNIAASAGKMTSENMSRVALALSQVAAAGKLQGDELNQLSEAGIPALKAVMDAYGLTREEATKLKEQGGITAEMLITSLQKMGLEGEQFAGSMANQMDQPLGALEALKSNMEAARADALKPLTDEMGNLVVGLAKFSQSKDFQGFVAGVTAAVKAFIGILKENLAPLMKTSFDPNMLRGFAEGALTFLRNFGVGVDLTVRQVGNFASFTGDQFKNVTTAIAAAMQIVGNSFNTFGSALDKMRQGDFLGAFDEIKKGAERGQAAYKILGDTLGATKDRIGEYMTQSRANAVAAAEDGAKISTAFTTAFDEVQVKSDEVAKSVAGDLAEIGEPKVKPEAIKKFSDDLIQVAKDQAKAYAKAAEDIAEIEENLNEKLNAQNAKRAEQIKDLIKEERRMREELEDSLAELDKKRADEKVAVNEEMNAIITELGKALSYEERQALEKSLSDLRNKEEATQRAYERQGQYGKQYAELLSQLQKAQTEEQRESIAEQIHQLERKELKEKDIYDKAYAQERQQTINKQTQAALRTHEVNQEADAAIAAATREAEERKAKVREREAEEILKSAEKRDKLIEDNLNIAKFVDYATGQINLQGQALINAKRPSDELAKSLENVATQAAKIKLPAGFTPTDMTTDNVPHFQHGGITGSYGGPAVVHPNEAIIPLAALGPIVQAELQRWREAGRPDLDNFYTDYKSWTKEMIGNFLQQANAERSTASSAGTAAVTFPGQKVVDLSPVETEASKAYRKQVEEESAKAAKEAAEAQKEAAKILKEAAEVQEKAAKEAQKAAEERWKEGVSSVQTGLQGMDKLSPHYRKNLQTIMDRLQAGHISEEVAARSASGVFGSYEKASGITAAKEKAAKEAAFAESLARLLGFGGSGEPGVVLKDQDRLARMIAEAVAAQPITLVVDGQALGSIVRRLDSQHALRNNKAELRVG